MQGPDKKNFLLLYFLLINPLGVVKPPLGNVPGISNTLGPAAGLLPEKKVSKALF